MGIFNLYFKVKISSLEEREKVVNHLRDAGFYYPDDDIDKSEVLGILVGNAYIGEMTTEAGFNNNQHKEYTVDEVLNMKFKQDYAGKICGYCDAFCECSLGTDPAKHDDPACPGFDDTCISQLK